MINAFLLFFLVACCYAILYEGDECVLENSDQIGKCRIISKCPYAKSLLVSGVRPQNCGYDKEIPIVCCISSNENSIRKSEQFCNKYYSDEIPVLGIIGGEKVESMEFPHMAILGYGNLTDPQWLCGGTLISENFVLTAAHCVFPRGFGQVALVRLGELDLNSKTDTATQDIPISNIYVHPDYNTQLHYHDIALLQLNTSVIMDDFISPACLYPEKDITNKNLTVTGWGLTDFSGNPSNYLLKTDLQLITHRECQMSYYNTKRKLNQGIVDEIQICAWNPGKDTCQGDSGGPLQFKWKKHFKIVGVTSFGKACGIGRVPGVYTRVFLYLNWIEGVVWPN